MKFSVRNKTFLSNDGLEKNRTRSVHRGGSGASFSDNVRRPLRLVLQRYVTTSKRLDNSSHSAPSPAAGAAAARVAESINWSDPNIVQTAALSQYERRTIDNGHLVRQKDRAVGRADN